MRRFFRLGVLLLSAVLCSTCATAPRTAAVGPPTPPTNQTGAVQQLMIEALTASAEAYSPAGPVETVRTSLSLAERALEYDGTDETANFYMARAALWLLEFGGDCCDRAYLIRAGLQRAEAALAKNDQRGEYHFLVGALMGYQLREQAVPRLSAVPEVQKHLTRAIELNTAYDDGAAWRALGALLVRAPAWPLSIGDPEAGAEMLEKAATQFPYRPDNHIYLAEAYFALGRVDEARVTLRHAEDALKTRDWGTAASVWRKQIDELRANNPE